MQIPHGLQLGAQFVVVIGQRERGQRVATAEVGPVRPGRFDLTNATDDIDLFKGTSGRFLGYSAAEITEGERPKIVASAVDQQARVVIVAQRVGRGTVIRFGLPQLPSRLRTDPDVQALLERTWRLLSR